MTLDEIMEIVGPHLENELDDDALASSQRDVAISIINKLVGQSLDGGFLEILKLAAEVHSELSFFSGIDVKNTKMVHFTFERLEKLISTYEKFREIVDFLYQHYENLDFGEFSESLKKEDLKNFIDVLKLRYDAYNAQFQGSGRVLFYSNDFSTIKNVTDLVYKIILGKEKSIEFMREFNSANVMIRQIQAELEAQGEGNAKGD